VRPGKGATHIRRPVAVTQRSLTKIILSANRCSDVPRPRCYSGRTRIFATTLVRGGTDLVTVADMLGHARLDTVRLYTHPTVADRERALNLLPHDR